MNPFQLFYILASLVFGSIIGSFLNVVILRLPLEKNLKGRSSCTHCKHQLSGLDLIPVFSFIFLRGKCRYCKNEISPRYFIIEIITGILFAFATWQVAPQNLADCLQLAKYFVALSTLLVVFQVDWEHFLILDSVLLTGGIIYICFSVPLDLLQGKLINLNGGLTNGLFAAILGPVPFFLIWYFSKGEWMGFGDVKFAVFLGIILGFPKVFLGIMLSVILGGIVSIFLLIFTKNTLKSRIPFGTFLSIGAFLTLFYGDKILAWYLSFLRF